MTMTEENNIETLEGDNATEAVATQEVEATADNSGDAPARRPRGERPERGEKREKPKKEFEELLLEVRRVTRVNTG